MIAPPTTLLVESVGVTIRGDHILTDVSLPPIPAGTVTIVIGPNGAGKSTLIRRIAGITKGSGVVQVVSSDTRRTDSIAYLPQDPLMSSAMTVYEAIIVAYQQGRGLSVSPEARAAVSDVLDQLGLSSLAGRSLIALSGGQRQLVGLAQALVRRPEVVLLDEPTSNLDIHNQLLLLEMVHRYARSRPAAVVVSMHDLFNVSRFADVVVVLRGGRLHAVGTPESILTEQMFREVYRVETDVRVSSDDNVSISVLGTVMDDSEVNR